MKLSEEMKSLYNNFQPLKDQFSAENEGISAVLHNESIKNNLEYRLRIAEIVGIIKFLNNLPIFVPTVEQKILSDIETKAVANSLNPALTTTFFQVIMDHSKAVQSRLGELLKNSPVEAKQALEDATSSLKKDFPDKTNIFDTLADHNLSAPQRLTHCRELIQGASNNVLDNMTTIFKETRTPMLSKLFRHAPATEMVEQVKLPSGEAYLWPSANSTDAKTRSNSAYRP